MESPKEIYTDETKMPYGNYKGYIMKAIPKKYFENVWKNQKEARTELLEYIKSNAVRLGLNLVAPTEKLKLAKYVPGEKVVEFICQKKTFPTEKDARQSLKRIREAGGKHEKPMRVYECPDCSGWHLTSMPIETFKNTSPSQVQN